MRWSASNVLAVLVALYVGASCAVVLAGPATVQAVTVVDALGFDVPGDSLWLVNLQWLEPRETHAGVWRDVEWCLGMESDIALRWGVADFIIDPQDGTLAYGATIFNDEGEPVAIVLERDYWLSAPIISHEAIHAITRTSNESSEAFRCQMRVAPPLPLRQFPADSVAKYRAILNRGG